jgi:predicted nucleotidyltransferase
VPRRSASAERLFEHALGALSRALRRARVPWMIIGGIALIARGVRRVTTDIDVAVRGDATTIDHLIDQLAREDIAMRIPDAARFARENLVLLARHSPTGIDLDVSLAWSSFEHEALEAATRASFGNVRIPVSTAEDLLVFKAVAGRARDIEDAEALLVLHPRIDVDRARGRVVDLAKLAEAPEIVDAFDALVARARSGTSRR